MQVEEAPDDETAASAQAAKLLDTQQHQRSASMTKETGAATSKKGLPFEHMAEDRAADESWRK